MTKVPKIISASSEAEAVSHFITRNHGSIMHEFGSLMRAFGKESARDIQIIDAALSQGATSISESSLGAAFAASDRLAKLIDQLPATERRAQAFHLTQKYNTLLLCEKEFGTLFAGSLTDYYKVRNIENLAKATKELPHAIDPALIRANFLAAIAKADGQSALSSAWSKIARALPMGGQALADTSNYIAKNAEKIRAVWPPAGKTLTAAESQVLGGYFSNTAGTWGEFYGLSDSKIRGIIQRHVAEAEEVAYGFGAGYRAEFFMQKESGFLLNGREGPDGIIAIFHEKKRFWYNRSQFEVKTAKTSEGLEQTLVGALERQAGGLPDSTWISPHITFPDGESYVVARHPAVRQELYVINTMDSRIPAVDQDLAMHYSIPIVEELMDLTTGEVRAINMAMFQAAMKDLK